MLPVPTVLARSTRPAYRLSSGLATLAFRHEGSDALEPAATRLDHRRSRKVMQVEVDRDWNAAATRLCPDDEWCENRAAARYGQHEIAPMTCRVARERSP